MSGISFFFGWKEIEWGLIIYFASQFPPFVEDKKKKVERMAHWGVKWLISHGTWILEFLGRSKIFKKLEILDFSEFLNLRNSWLEK